MIFCIGLLNAPPPSAFHLSRCTTTSAVGGSGKLLSSLHSGLPSVRYKASYPLTCVIKLAISAVLFCTWHIRFPSRGLLRMEVRSLWTWKKQSLSVHNGLAQSAVICLLSTRIQYTLSEQSHVLVIWTDHFGSDQAHSIGLNQTWQREGTQVHETCLPIWLLYSRNRMIDLRSDMPGNNILN